MWSSAAAPTVSLCVPDVRPLLDAVSVGVPATVSRYRKLPFVWPAGTVMLVIVAVSVVLRNVPPEEEVVRMMVVADEGGGDAGWLFDPWICTVMVPPVVPAVSVWELVMNTIFEAGAALAGGARPARIVMATTESAVTAA